MRKIIAVFAVISIFYFVPMTNLLADGRTVVVNSAGSVSANGPYSEGGVYETKLYFSMVGVGETYYLAWSITDDPDQWTISVVPDGDSGKKLYYNTQDTDLPPKTGWQTNYTDGALDDPPTLSGDGTLPDPITVNIAGSVEVRGEYAFDGVVRGKNAYNKDADLYRIVWVTVPDFGVTETGWYMSKTSPPAGYYFNPNDWGVEPPATGWTNAIVVGLVGIPPMPVLTGDVSLPVELTSFSAQMTDQGVLLEWVTESEVDNLGYILDRRLQDVTKWTTITSYQTHPDLEGKGNTSSRTEYEYMDVTAQSGMTYHYRLSEVATDGNITILDVIEITMEMQIPEETSLQPPFPNPFNPQTKISYKLAEQANVNLNVYDMNGRLVSRLLENTQQSAGSYSIHWLGKDDFGRQTASGTYILRMVAGEVVQTQKVLLMR